MRITALMVFVLLLCSCSSQVKYYEYYEYHEGAKSKDSLSLAYYCTLEVTKDKAIYRSSLKKLIYPDKHYINYLHIDLKNADTFKFGDFEKMVYYLDYISLKNPLRLPIGIDIKKYTKVEFCQDSMYQRKPSDWLYEYTDKDRLEFPLYKKEGNSYRLISMFKDISEYHFDHTYLEYIALWFPPKLKRTRRIDYSLFSIPKDLRENVTDENYKNCKIGETKGF